MDTCDEICSLATQLSSENAEYFLKLLKHVLNSESDKASETNELDFLHGRFQEAVIRVGLDFDSLPKNLSWGGGGSPNGKYELAKEWHADGSRFHLKRFEFHGVEIILLYRLAIRNRNIEFHVRLLTPSFERSAEMSVPF